jgi:hypothetical protein
MSKPRDERQKDLFRPALDQIIDMGHPLVRLAQEIDWSFLEQRFASVCEAGPGQPPLPARLVAGLFILKHTHSLSDEALCARWLENPYYQSFCGEQVFRHELAFERSSMSRWRGRLGEENLEALLQESLSVAHKTGALETKDLERVVLQDEQPGNQPDRQRWLPRTRRADRGEPPLQEPPDPHTLRVRLQGQRRHPRHLTQGARLARFPPPRGALHCRMRIPGLRAESASGDPNGRVGLKPPTPASATIRALRRHLLARRFAVPKLQRNFVWDAGCAAKLLDRIYREMPIYRYSD